MTADLWNPVAFTAGPLNTFEAVYLDEAGPLTRVPIIGVLIEEQVELGPNQTLIHTGATRSVLAHQVEPGSVDIQAAGGSTLFVGVFEVGQEPTTEFLDRARARAADL